MRSKYTKSAIAGSIPTIAAMIFAAGSSSYSHAQCGGVGKLLDRPAAFKSFPGVVAATQPRLLLASLPDGDDVAPEPSIVGMWHVKFIAMGNEGIPDKTEVDAGFAQWHSDGTEIMNSGGRAPSTSSFCLGVWEKTGVRTYVLNHFAISWDPAPSTGNPDGVILGPASIRETITLNPAGTTFSGAFTIIQYDESLDKKAEVKGIITGTRVTVTTPPSSIF